MNKIIICIIIISGSILSISCEKSKVEAWIETDAFILSRVMNEDTVFGISLYARSNKTIETITCQTSISNKIEMVQAYKNSQYEFVYQTDTLQMNLSIPNIGSYVFDAKTKEGEEITQSDIVTNKYIVPTIIDSCIYDSLYTKLNIYWQKVENSSYSILFLINKDGKEVYSSGNMSPSTTSKSITSNESKWLAANRENGIEGRYEPSESEEFTVKISSFLTDASNPNKTKLQGMSINTTQVIWHNPIEINK